jgi:hypothetical protein
MEQTSTKRRLMKPRVTLLQCARTRLTNLEGLGAVDVADAVGYNKCPSFAYQQLRNDNDPSPFSPFQLRPRSPLWGLGSF